MSKDNLTVVLQFRGVKTGNLFNELSDPVLHYINKKDRTLCGLKYGVKGAWRRYNHNNPVCIECLKIKRLNND